MFDDDANGVDVEGGACTLVGVTRKLRGSVLVCCKRTVEFHFGPNTFRRPEVAKFERDGPLFVIEEREDIFLLDVVMNDLTIDVEEFQTVGEIDCEAVNLLDRNSSRFAKYVTFRLDTFI